MCKKIRIGMNLVNFDANTTFFFFYYFKVNWESPEKFVYDFILEFY